MPARWLVLALLASGHAKSGVVREIEQRRRDALETYNDGKDAAVELAALKQAPADPYGGDV